MAQVELTPKQITLIYNCLLHRRDGLDEDNIGEALMYLFETVHTVKLEFSEPPTERD